MNMTARRLRSIGWIATLVVCAALVMVLAFRVNALRSQVHQSNLKIIALRQETSYLETEFETRASQQTLKTLNDVEFGYVAPAASQYLDNERQLAAYAKPVEPGAPTPIRVASADQTDNAGVYPAMVSPMSGKPMHDDDAADDTRASTAAHDADDAPVVKHPAVAAVGLAGLRDRLGTVRHTASGDAPKPVAKASAKSVADKHKAKPALAAKPVHGKDRVAIGATVHHGADAHRHPGSPPVKLALKDAKTVK